MDHTSTAVTAANAAVATSITVWGMATGLSYEVLLAGFAGGLVSLSFLGPMSIWRRIWTPFTATLTAGYSSPVWSYYLAKIVPPDGNVNTLALTVFSAFTIGVMAQVLIPLAIRYAEKRAQSLEGPTT